MLDAVARTGSVTQAASMLHMTSSAVSQQLRRIEAEVGAKIVVPDGRGVRLTAKGQVLAGYARQVADLMQQADNDLHRDEAQVGHLRIGAIASIVRTLLAERLPTFQQAHPRIRVSVEDGETTDHLDRLASGHLDLVLGESWSAAPLRLPAGVHAQQVNREPLGVALPATHPLSSRSQVHIRDLVHEPWTTCAEGSDPHTALTQVARQHSVELDIRYHVSDQLTQLTLVRAGLAIACLPPSSNVTETSGVSYSAIAPTLHRDTVLLSTDRTASHALEALAAHIRS